MVLLQTHVALFRSTSQSMSDFFPPSWNNLLTLISAFCFLPGFLAFTHFLFACWLWFSALLLFDETITNCCHQYLMYTLRGSLCVGMCACVQESQISRQRRTIVPSVPQNAEREARNLFAKEVLRSSSYMCTAWPRLMSNVLKKNTKGDFGVSIFSLLRKTLTFFIHSVYWQNSTWNTV